MTNNGNIKAYDPSKMVEKKLAEVGDKIDAIISDIKAATLGELIPQEILEKWENANPDAPAIEIIATCADGSIRRRTLPVPADNQIHPNSNLAKWKKYYNGFPMIGQKIHLLADEKGFYQFRV